MKLYSEQEIKKFMKNKDIVLDGEYIEINDSRVNREILIKSLKQLQMKNMNEKESFNQYKNGNGQKSRNKIRKG